MSNDKLFLKDIEDIVNKSSMDWNLLIGAKILITGATGIIGYALISLLLNIEKNKSRNVLIYALTRDCSNAARVFEKYSAFFGKNLIFIESDICAPLSLDGIDYIVHGAAETTSGAFVRKPVETISTTIDGTKNILEFAKMQKAKRTIFLSTMEVYGYPQKGHMVTENEAGSFSSLSVRNSYPISKLAAEMLCVSYFKEYGIPLNILRLTQTFGPNVRKNDTRFFAYLLNCIKKKEDIVLKSRGKTERSYLYSLDAATAILHSALCNKAGDIFNVANESLYCSIYDFATKIGKKYGLRVVIDENTKEITGYADTLYINMDTTRIRETGWKPSILDIDDIYDRMI